MNNITILGIESSCDDTSAAVFTNEYELSNIIANQEVHKTYGGVVPELASRAHQKNIVPVVDTALKQAHKTLNDLDAVAFTRGPGLLGSLLVGTSFAKGLSIARNIPLIAVNHLQSHMLVHFIKKTKSPSIPVPEFPFLGLLVSGGHTQIIIIRDYLHMEIIGNTIDDAAGEAFDKCAKVMGLPYPGGPVIDKYAQKGNPTAFSFNKPSIKELDYSFSGLKTSFLYFLRDQLKLDDQFIQKNIHDLCASLQHTITEILMYKLILASQQTGIKTIAIAGGVAANSGLRNALLNEKEKRNWSVFIPEIKYTMDNAAMVAITGYYKYLNREFTEQTTEPAARWEL